MFHTTHIHMPYHRRPSALRTFITSSSFGRTDNKEPLRRGVLLSTVACVLLLIGSILTWLGFNDVFGGKMSMTGPLLIALALLLMLLSFRQFLLACKRNAERRRPTQLDSLSGGTLTAVVVNQDDGLHPATIIMDRYGASSFENSLAIHRNSFEDCAPPSYHEVTQHSNSSNTPSCIVQGEQDELPPTYEETVGATIYPSSNYISTSALYREPQSRIVISSPSRSAMCTSVETIGRARNAGSHYVAAKEDANPLYPTLPSAPAYQCSFKPSTFQTSVLPDLRLDPPPRISSNTFNQNTEPPLSPLYQNQTLTLPVHHMSAPSSPRQLSAPPSPRNLSAPASPRLLLAPAVRRQLSAPVVPSQLLTLPSPCHLSAPTSPRQLPTPSSPYNCSFPFSHGQGTYIPLQSGPHESYTCFTFNFAMGPQGNAASVSSTLHGPPMSANYSSTDHPAPSASSSLVSGCAQNFSPTINSEVLCNPHHSQHHQGAFAASQTVLVPSLNTDRNLQPRCYSRSYIQENI